MALGAATANGITLFAKNSDRPPTERQVIRWLAPQQEEPRVRATHIEIAGHPTETIASVVSMPEWCWGAEHGVNEAGVVVGNETIYTTSDPRAAPDALIGMDLVRLALQRSTTATGAVAVIDDHIARYGQGGSGHDTRNGQRRRPYWSSFLVADPGDAWVVETSGNLVEAMRVERTWAISNRTTIPAFDAVHRHPRQPVERLVDPRLNASRKVLMNDPVDADALLRHMASHVGGENGWTVCMHAVDGGQLVEATTASMVVEMEPDPIVHWVQGSPCTTRYETRRFSEMAHELSGR